MKKWIFLLIVIFLGVLQVTLLNYFRFFGVGPDILLVVVVFGALILEPRVALTGIILAGIIKDLFTSLPLPLNTILFVAWYFIIIKLTKEISIENNLIRLALIFIVVFLHHLISGASLIYLGNFIPLGIFLRNLFLASIYTTAVSLLILKLIKKLLGVS